MNLYEISRVIFPELDFVDNKGLFLNKLKETINLEGKIKNINVSKFNTWMNLFAAKKYYYYCELGDLYLKLDIEGSYIIRVIGSNRSAAFDRVDTVLLEIKCENHSELRIPNAFEYDGIYFELIEYSDAPVKINRISYATDKIPQRDNKLAVVTCTFKREDYITKNISKFEQFLSENPDLNEKIKLFISDNGKTLPESLNSKNVTIYPNMNAGGAGGFTRGLMEVMNLNEGYTRVLFMDDDVEIFQECLHRTLLLTNYLKSEYNEAFINGAMMDLSKKNIFHENLAYQYRLFVNADNRRKDVTDYDTVLELNEVSEYIFADENKKISSAWWFHCLNVETVKEKGLPCPLFIRGDDVEWSWRNFGKHHISLNGICIWHAPFEYRISKVVDSYYSTRNFFFMNLIHNKNFKKQYKKYCKETFNQLLKYYDYVSCELYIKALNDILSGSVCFKCNPESQFKKLNDIAKKNEYFNASDKELYQAKNFTFKFKKWIKLLYWITGKGIYCPNFLFKNNSITVDWYPPAEHYMLIKEIKAYNLLTKKYELRKFDRKKILYYQKEFNRLLNQIDKNYDKLHKDFLEAHKEFSTKEFWEKYLELNTIKNENKEKLKV